ncbi:MAG: T9SS type A sorting domain-containing protein, partial [Crocinitomicaceae bacterium]|nr:T9SS type A sorting domain-containing protein [Crocinitomicaceae bacterium]
IINEIGSVQEDNSLVSLKEKAPEPSFSIYPNPSTGKFFVENNSDKKSILSIYQMNGKKIFEKHFIKNTLVNIEKQKRGTYLFVIETDKKIKRLKVVNF